MTWEGDVDGAAILIIQGDRVNVDTRNTGSVARTNYRFNDPLDARERVDVENRLGGARVRVLEQPRRNNNYTAMVEIDTRGRGMQRVSLDFYWDERGAVSRNNRNDRYGEGTRSRTNDRLGNSGNANGLARWSGQVDDEVFVLMRGRQFFSTAVRGRTVYNQQTDITNPLPRRPVNVTLQDARGRGQIEIAEQPDSRNNFTAKIRITDPEAGAGTYGFTLGWDDSGNNSGNYNQDTYPNGGVLSPGGYSGTDSYGSGVGGVRWAGQVDGRVRVSFRDNQAFTQRLSGQEVYGQQVNFANPVPRRNVDVAVNKLRGRGDVQIVQRPSASNNYTVMVEINDTDGGADVYELEIAWR
jgi:hypothetical protein